MADSIILKHIKGIENLEYALPDKPGVYVITGSNGCGKTSLLVGLNRIGNSMSYQNYLKDEPIGASFQYNINGKTVNYIRGGVRWVPKPKSESNLISQYTYHQTYFLSATGLRMYSQDPSNLKAAKFAVAASICESMNKILDTTRFSQLQYVKVAPMKGKQPRLYRKNKLFVLKDANGTYYTERNFSLGERMLLNAIDYINDIRSAGMLIIDEIELALHPIAQCKFMDYLEEKAKTNNLVIILSTHSATLIKRAKKLHYLERIGNLVNALYDIKPAYVLRDVATDLDSRPDLLILVEDEMARAYVQRLLPKFTEVINKYSRCSYKILPIGGYDHLPKMARYLTSIQPFNEDMVFCLFDADVKPILSSKRALPHPYPNDLALIQSFNSINGHYEYLSITPEVGLWNELVKDNTWLQTTLEEMFGPITFALKPVITTIDSSNTKTNPRDRAKDCVKDLYSELNKRFGAYTYPKYVDDIWRGYIRHMWTDTSYQNMVKQKFGQMFGKLF